jgi:mono/diheme cytochrome c family protein
MKTLPDRSLAMRCQRRKIVYVPYLVLAAALFLPGMLFAADQTSTRAPATFEQYCVQCHSNAAKTAGIDLEALTARLSVGDDFKQWLKIASVLDGHKMPPPGMPQPSDEERSHAAGWIRTELDNFARGQAGDPGAVTVRRLTSAEYAYTVRDLTGIDLNVERDFAGDTVGGEGFTNFGDVQFMADANLENYLAAAKKIADHAVIGAGPLDFFADPGMSGFELSAITRIHDLYRKHGFRAVAAEGGRAFGLERYTKAFYAAWRFKHRIALGEANVTLAEFAAREEISPRFAEHIWSVVNQDSPSFPTSEVVSRFRDLPAPGTPAGEKAVREGCEEIQKFLINWPRWLFAAGELAAGGAGDERALVLTDAALEASPKREFNFRFFRRRERGAANKAASVYLSVVQANPNAAGDPVIIWRNPMVRVRKRDRGSGAEGPLSTLVAPETAAKIAFGRHPSGREIGPNDFVTVGDTELFFEVPLPEDAFGLTMELNAEADLAGAPDSVLRVTIAGSKESSRGTPTWALIAHPQSAGYQAWKKDVLEYAANLPQTSHGEPTPSDRDPIPQPFDNTYNQPERDLFHYRVKYFRDDNFLVEKMLDDNARLELERAWTDLMASFEFHDAILNFTAEKYKLDLQGKGIAALGDAEIAALPAEPRQYVKPLHADYQEMSSALLAAQPGHIDDCIRFASHAWRRPLSADEQDSLRAFYVKATEDLKLDHRKAVRALLARILVSPAFLYRLEEPEQPTGVSELSDWELAGRLSYFLWSSAPDEELRRAAAAGELHESKQLERQVKRMLADSKARRFATEFFGQWLGFYRFDQHRGVDTTRFPEFSDEVKAAMYDESISFFEHIVRQDRPVSEIFSADYTFVNQALAKHYGIEKEIKSTDKAEMLTGANEFHRGGLLRLGSVLTAMSAPLRTSPVKRGNWVLTQVLGTPTPPPPADAGTLPADPKLFGGQTVRARLEAHRRNPSCISCHTRIDPLGFPLEHFDSVGRWRETYSEGQPIEDSGTLSDKTEISGMDGLLAYLKRQEKQVVRNAATKLLGYALGRTVLASDLPLIDSMAQSGGGATFPTMAARIVTSKQFRNRRGKDEALPDPAAATGAAEE